MIPGIIIDIIIHIFTVDGTAPGITAGIALGIMDGMIPGITEDGMDITRVIIAMVGSDAHIIMVVGMAEIHTTAADIMEEIITVADLTTATAVKAI